MDTRRVVFKNEDGTCSVVAGFYRNNEKGVLSPIPIEEIIITGSPKLRALIEVDENGNEQETFQGVFERIGAQGLKAVHEYRVCNISDLPNDRTFREAWEYNNNSVNINMPKARNIHLNNLRIERDKKLVELDIETLKGNDIQAEKQILRDLPANIDLLAANTPEELKAIWPAELL